MIIIGIDPGVIYTGYGVIKTKERCARALDYGMIKIAREQELPARLAGVYERIAGLCEQLQPDALAVEEVFFNKNARTALTVGHMRGAIILAALHQGVEVFSYTPLQIKQTVSGYGRADKEQVQRMVKLLLKLKELPKPDHAADALAAAICHYYMSRSTSRLLSGAKWGGAR